jgi:hypothetical protein
MSDVGAMLSNVRSLSAAYLDLDCDLLKKHSRDLVLTSVASLK